MQDKSRWARNLGTLHDDSASTAPGAAAFVFPATGATVTYGEFATEVASAGNGLLDLNVARGERVALCFRNGLDFLAVYFGAMRAGAVPVPVNVEAATDDVRHVVEDSRTRVVLAGDDDDLRDVAADAARESSNETLLATYGGTASTRALKTVDFEKQVDDAAVTLEPADVTFNDPALQPYSSGSTGVPKGIVLSHGGAFWNTKRFQQVNLMDEHDVALVATPLYHKNAMLNTKTTLLAGGTVVVIDGFDSSEVIKTIDEHGVTYLTGVPALYHYLVEDEDTLAAHDVTSVEAGSTGSDTVPDRLYDEFEAKFGAPLTEGYGLTEGGPMITMTPRWGLKKRGSAGIPLPEVDARVVDPKTGEELPDGVAGELVVASPGVAEYHDLPDVSAERFEERDGKQFLHTGDVVKRDEDGYHYVVGRLDDMLIVGGENVSPATIEDRLAQHDAVAESVVVPVSHQIKNEVPVAFVIPRGEVTEADLKEFAVECGPAYSHPRRIFFIDDFPLSGTEKVDRKELEERARDRVGTLSPSHES